MPDAQSAVRQGVTLALGGPDGGGPWPFGAYLDSADRAGLGMNVAYLTGHNTIRKVVMGTENRAPILTATILPRRMRLTKPLRHTWLRRPFTFNLEVFEQLRRAGIFFRNIWLT